MGKVVNDKQAMPEVAPGEGRLLIYSLDRSLLRTSSVKFAPAAVWRAELSAS